MFRAVTAIALTVCALSRADAGDLPPFREVQLPAGQNAREPFLHASPDGRLLMSWTDMSGGAPAVKFAALQGGTWSAPRVVVASSRLFVNWADFPSIAAFADGTLAAHWLQVSGGSTFDYDVRIALSRDDGGTWSAPIVPHRDGTTSQHGFVTLMPFGNELVALWLDGRAYDGELVEDGAQSGQMQLRAATLSPEGAVTPDIALDVTTCSCCQTAAAVAEDALLVVYRDRTADEIRDISLVSFRDGRWSAPASVHDDNWEIPGCPVNGPSISAQGRQVAVAWFTGADDVPAVKVAFSPDAGASFGEAVRIDLGEPAGRVDTLMLDDGTALVSWVEWLGSDETLLYCRANSQGCGEVHRLAVNTEGSSMNFPQMAATPEGIYVAWTQPLPDGRDTVRMLRAPR